ncbi:MAG: Hsp70 family protein [Erysipelotrichales bacterium]|nr:Hsp70 family protein [Erysipelotrichales bacterium]
MAIIGIDLGTTNSLVSVFKDGKSILIPNQFGEVLTPSVVSVENGKVVVGKIAKERLITHTENTVAAFKVFMGSDKIYHIDAHDYTPIELSAMIIKQLVEDAKNYLQEDIQEAVISVPAYFNDMKRVATKQAGELAGIKVDRIINEPSAAALSARIHQSNFETLLVFDLGGGTLDVSIVDCFEDVVEIIAISGDNHLGGEDFNRTIEDYFITTYSIPPLSQKDRSILLRNIEEMKKELSEKESSERRIYLSSGMCHAYLSRDILLKICEKLLFRMKSVIKKALVDAHLNVSDIERLIMVGGSSRLIVVQEYLEYLFHKQPEVDEQVDYLVGLGCGYVAGIKERNEDIKDKVLTDICPFSLGIDTYNYGSKDLLYSIIIERNTTLPCSCHELYTTIRHGQKKVEFKIYQGEDVIAKNNHCLGEMSINVPKNVAGAECIDVCFTYDINGILDVEVTSLSTQEKIHSVFTSHENILSQEEIEVKLKELEQLKKKEEDLELIYLYEKACRIFQESVGEKRKDAGIIIEEINRLKKAKKMIELTKSKRNIMKKLEQLDTQSPFIYEEEGLIN